MNHTQIPGQPKRSAQRGFAACAVLAMAAGLTFATVSMADSSGIGTYAPIGSFTPVAPYGQGLSSDSQKWPALTFSSGMSSSSHNDASQSGVALHTLGDSVLARNIQVGLAAGNTAVLTGSSSSFISTGNTNSASQTSNVVLLGK
ncbi:hypothetical protein [Candidimonas nitroreducens]|uniref:Uncharacterized protein n=1 Tax=Candidimonas nitroreducens TaxID=683354 RepID=A0A225MYB5_9BURK|nr:hypothetical protein [Candidimonas nitroreducens]OWT66215.1 hypothetical protein CEY11_00235 [Candidimonas nitroreducens]